MSKSLKVLHLVSGSLAGGAARGVLTLHRALRDLGVDSTMLVDHGEVFTESDIRSTESGPSSKFVRQIRWHVDAAPLKLYPQRLSTPYSPGIVGAKLLRQVKNEAPDIVNLHWVNAGFVNVRHLQRLGKPIVWTLRDLWPITGGCHYPLDCDKYIAGCGSCPQLGSRAERDLSRLMSMCKQRAYVASNLTFVGISEWISSCARRSSVTGASPVETILNCVDTDVFFPVDKRVAKAILGLPQDTPIVLFGAQNPRDSYKGFESLEGFLKIAEASDLPYHIVTFGTTPRNLLARIKLRSTPLGFLRDDLALRLAYSAADVFVAPSHQEAFGKTIAEALSCGTPTVAYDIGGPNEVISHGLTGYLAVPYQSADIAEGVACVLAKNRDGTMSAACRTSAIDRFSPKRAAQEYSDLYRKILFAANGLLGPAGNHN